MNYQRINRLSDLTKKERAAWISEHGVIQRGTVLEAETAVEYIIRNNEKEAIAEWLKHATTTFVSKEDEPFFCTVFEFNRLTEYCNGLEVKGLAKRYGLSVRALADRFSIPQRTMEDWSAGKRKPPEYVLRMMEQLLMR